MWLKNVLRSLCVTVARFRPDGRTYRRPSKYHRDLPETTFEGAGKGFRDLSPGWEDARGSAD
jgi:hypothetical protein